MKPYEIRLNLRERVEKQVKNLSKNESSLQKKPDVVQLYKHVELSDKFFVEYDKKKMSVKRLLIKVGDIEVKGESLDTVKQVAKKGTGKTSLTYITCCSIEYYDDIVGKD